MASLIRGEHPIVRRALDLLMELPEAPALKILDQALEGVHGSDPTFENHVRGLRASWLDHLDPPAPFAELVRRAFAPKLDPHDWMLLAADDQRLRAADIGRLDRAAVQWDEAIGAFADRYRLWQ
ncbi:hypothetical protein HLB44_30945 [Aquincola sp. S2]|uniref:Uncharacterized protein n=1 Tax=Pseudaquabacterium terrae TaxID=2732868 RepID=A0ABX2ERZ9_9BURK|nr:hypothetical protein [Aquabacterium terrae]NRF71412.1 hypothetical protein [Aquabacterium terrae]